MTAISLLRHAIGLLTMQPLKTLTVIGPALALMIGLSILIAFTAPDILANADSSPLGAVPSNWILLVALALSYSLMAILWHRHTLSGLGTPPPLSATLLLSYLWRVVLLTGIQISLSLALIVPLLVSSQHSGAEGEAPAFLSVILTTFVTQLLLVWLSLRLSLILPAAAIGAPIRMVQSWRYTSPVARTLWSIAAILAIFNTVLTIVVTRFDLTTPIHTLVLELPVYVFEGMLIFSILTTLYARQVHDTPMNPK
ncbi:MAG: hypothetical protein V7661_03670 [Sulfitobacter sp.]